MEDKGIRPASKRWIGIATIWIVFGLFNATQTVAVMRTEGMHHDWPKLFFVTMLSWLPWALGTGLALRIGVRGSGRAQLVRMGLVHIAACATIGLTFAAWTTLLEILFNPYANPPAHTQFVPHWLDLSYNGIFSSLVLYAGILVIGYALDSRERLSRQQTETARLNERLSQAQLSALRRQIEPHFLFNALSAISGLVREGRAGAAVGMIAALSDFLRKTLEESTRQEVPLSEEMDFVQKYLDIQKARFADRLQLSVDVPPEFYPVPVPNLILQPLVENAVKHGVSKRARGGAIRITASARNGMLALSVSNDGPSLPPNWESAGGGIGLANVRARLRSLYGDDFALCMQNLDAGGVEILISVPLRNCAALA
jgi:two-component system, LytTR family, sensor kinase